MVRSPIFISEKIFLPAEIFSQIRVSNTSWQAARCEVFAERENFPVLVHSMPILIEQEVSFSVEGGT